MKPDPDHALYPGYHEGIRTFLQRDGRGEPFLYATTWLKEGGWRLVVRREKADAFADLSAAVYRIILITLMGGIGIVVAAVLITDYMVNRIRIHDLNEHYEGGYHTVHLWTLICLSMGVLGENEREYLGPELASVGL